MSQLDALPARLTATTSIPTVTFTEVTGRGYATGYFGFTPPTFQGVAAQSFEGSVRGTFPSLSMAILARQPEPGAETILKVRTTTYESATSIPTFTVEDTNAVGVTSQSGFLRFRTMVVAQAPTGARAGVGFQPMAIEGSLDVPMGLRVRTGFAPAGFAGDIIVPPLTFRVNGGFAAAKATGNIVVPQGLRARMGFPTPDIEALGRYRQTIRSSGQFASPEAAGQIRVMVTQADVNMRASFPLLVAKGTINVPSQGTGAGFSSNRFIGFGFRYL